MERTVFTITDNILVYFEFNIFVFSMLKKKTKMETKQVFS